MTNEIVMYKGDSKTILLTITQESTGLAYNLQGCTVTMYIKAKMTDKDEKAIIAKTGDLVEAVNGKVQFSLIPSDTLDAHSLKSNTCYSAKFEVTSASDENFTALLTRFTILA